VNRTLVILPRVMCAVTISHFHLLLRTVKSAQQDSRTIGDIVNS